MDAFRASLAAVRSYQELKARADKGEKNLDFQIFLAEWELGTLDWEQAKARVAAMPKLAKADRAKAEQILQDAEVLHVGGTARDEGSFEAAGKRFLEMLEAGYAPGARAERSFWSLLLRWSDMRENLAAYEKAVAYMKKLHANDPRMAEFLKGLDQRLEELRAKPGGKP